jgi:hypothetical protein
MMDGAAHETVHPAAGREHKEVIPAGGGAQSS